MNTIAQDYEVRSVLGQGSTGIVYDALRREDGSSVVVKVMHPALAGDDKLRQRFQRESAKLRKLSGPHIRPILDSGEATSREGKAQLYMTRAKVDGSSLAEIFASGELMPVERGLDIVNEICDGLRLAHAHGIIHRNLKPANVLLERGGGVVVVDIGLSQIVSDSGVGTPDLTVQNTLFGAPEYMSPEQASGEALDARCDVYSVGIILYEILTGSPPFAGRRPLAILTAHLAREIEAPTARAPAGRISPALEQVVLRALARDRNDRYESIAALQDALASVRNGAARQAPAAVRPKTSGLPASAPVSVAPSRARPSKSAAPEQKAEPSRSGSRTWVTVLVLLMLAALGGAGYWANLHHYFHPYF